MASTSREPYREKTLRLGHKIFLSYSGADQTFLWELYDDLIEHHYFPFFDKESLPTAAPVSMGNIVQEAGECKLAVFLLSESFFTRNRNPMMELVECVKKRVQLLPLFYEISVDTIKNRKESWYTGVWSEWGVDGKDFKSALDTLLHMSGIENREGWRPREFRRRVLEEIHNLMSPDIMPYVSDVCGGPRLVQVVKDMFAHHLSQESDDRPVFLGLYGASGTGKSTLCKMLEHSSCEWNCRVCYIQLDSTFELEVERMRKVLRAVTNLSKAFLDQLKTPEQARNTLSQRYYDKKVFLIIDNVIPHKSMDEAESYLLGHFKPGSKVLVTAHTEGVLSRLVNEQFKWHIAAMPDLEEEEATQILLKRARSSRDLQVKDEQWKGLVERCLSLCRFRKGGERGDHYHPLVLNSLAESLSHYDLYDNHEEMTSWISSLQSRFGYVNAARERVLLHLLRSTSYNSLNDLQKQVFLDVALYLPRDILRKDELFQWLRSVHEEPIREAVWILERRGLIDGFAVSEEGLLPFPLMHGLYYEMATLIVEDKEKRKCLFIKGGDGSDEDLPRQFQQIKRIDLPDSSKIKRIFFKDCRFIGDFGMSSFPLVQVLGIRDCVVEGNLDLRGAAASLRSLEISCASCTVGEPVETLGLDDCDSLVYLSATRNNVVSSPCKVSLPTFDHEFPLRTGEGSRLRWLRVNFGSIKFRPLLDVSCCVHVETLELDNCNINSKHPDLRTLRNLRVFRYNCSGEFPSGHKVVFKFGREIERISIQCDHVSELRGLNHYCTKLRELELHLCPALTELEGLDELTSLKKVSLRGVGLAAFPRGLLKLGKQLQDLYISDCSSIPPKDVVDVLSMPNLPTQFYLACISVLMDQRPDDLSHDLEDWGYSWLWGPCKDPQHWEETLSLVVESKQALNTISNLLQDGFPYIEVLRLVLHLCVGERYVHLEELLRKPHVIKAFSQGREPFCLLVLALAKQQFGADLESHASSIATMVATAFSHLDNFAFMESAASIVSTNHFVATELSSAVHDRVRDMMDSSYDVREQLHY